MVRKNVPQSPPTEVPPEGTEDNLYTAQDLFGDLVDEPLEPKRPQVAAQPPRAVKVRVAERNPAGGVAKPPVDMSADEMAGLIDAFGGSGTEAKPTPKKGAAPESSGVPVKGGSAEFEVLLDGLQAEAPKAPAPRETTGPAKSKPALDLGGVDDFSPLLEQLTAPETFPESRVPTETATIQPEEPPSPLDELAALSPVEEPPVSATVLEEIEPPREGEAAPRVRSEKSSPARDNEIDDLLAGVMSDAEAQKAKASPRLRFNAEPPKVVEDSPGILDLGALADEVVESTLAEPDAGSEGSASLNPPSSFGPYKLLERIAAGGMAEVFKAKRAGVEGFEKVVAVKRILPHLSDNKEFVEMFIEEAKMVAGLTHPNIVQIFDLGRIDTTYFIAMEYVHGKDLRTILKRAKEKGLRIPLDLSVLVVSKVSSALESAHKKRDEDGRPLRIVHRDVSPQNILISFEGDVKLTDFGIAKATTKASSTDRGALRGKLLYMSPEQASGHPMDRRSDVFSLGVVFYEMITDSKLFLGSSEKGILEMVRECRIERPRALNPKIPETLEKVLMKALEKDPEHRYQDASELSRGLERALQGRQPPAATELARFMEVLFETGATSPIGGHESDDVLEIDLSPANPPAPLSEAGSEEDDDLEDLFNRVGK